MSEISGRELLIAPPGEKGDRGYSIVGFEQTTRDKVTFLTDGGHKIGPVLTPTGAAGQPSMTRLRRATEYLGLVVTFWAATEPAEMIVYGDTGVWQTSTGVKLRRFGSLVEVHGALTDLPIGFRPAVSQAAETDGISVFTTVDAWPTGSTLAGATKLTDPTPIDALGGYDAAVANGYVGTPESWNESLYLAGIPKGGAPGQYLQRTAYGSAWADLPRIGGEAWRDVVLNGSWRRFQNQPCQARFNNGTVEFRGWVEYIGPDTTAGIWRTTAVEIGTLPGDLAPDANMELVTTAYRGDNGRPELVRVNFTVDGSLALMTYQQRGETAESAFPVRRTNTQVQLSGVQWATPAATR